MKKGLSLFVILFMVTACSTYQRHAAQAKKSMRAGDFNKAAESLKEKALESSDDQLIYLLDYAIILQYAGQYDESNKAFQLADTLSEVKDYHSISKITASLLNESLIQYKGEDFEKVLINAFGAINFLMLGNMEGALVEARRLNEKLRLYKDEAKKNYEQNVFARYLSAMAWDQDGNYDSAYIDYEESYRLNPGFERLKEDLIRAAIKADRPAQLRKWKKEFPGVKIGKEWNNPAYGELVFIYQQGWGPYKQPHPSWHRIPKLYPTVSRTELAEIEVVGVGKARTEPIYSVQDVAIKTLDDAYAGLIAKRVAARAAQYGVAKRIGKENKALGELAFLAMSAIDQADLRQWSTLPATFQIARMYVPVGSYTLNIKGLSSGGMPTGENSAPKQIEILGRKKTFINWRSFQ